MPEERLQPLLEEMAQRFDVDRVQAVLPDLSDFRATIDAGSLSP